MAHDKAYQRANYPLMAYNFRVTIDGVSMSFAEISGLSREYKALTYRQGLSYWEGEDIVKYRFNSYTPVTMKRGSVTGSAFLYQWVETRKVGSMDVSLCDEQGVPVIRWRLARVLPSNSTPPRSTPVQTPYPSRASRSRPRASRSNPCDIV